jgi:hypothetical protein
MVNGQFGLILWFTEEAAQDSRLFQYIDERRLFGVVIPDVTQEGLITRFSFIINPDKLRHLVPHEAVDE